MDKKLYQTRCPDYPADHNAGRADPDFMPHVMQWLPEVFNDDMPVETKLEYVREYLLTVRSNLRETVKDVEKVLLMIERLKTGDHSIGTEPTFSEVK